MTNSPCTSNPPRTSNPNRTPEPSRDRGAALIIAIGFVVMIGAIAAGLTSMVTSGIGNRIALERLRDRQYAADGAIEVAVATMRISLDAGTATCGDAWAESANLNGVDIRVESAEGQGSRFILTFRAGTPGAEQVAASGASAGGSAPPATSTLRGKRVLITDDNALNRQVIKLFLAPQGCEFSEAANGREALDRLASQAFDLVLLDVHMPVMDGREAIQQIRSSEQPWSDLPVIALTADAMAGDREKYLALGMTDYLSKPVDLRELVAKMNEVLHLAATATPRAAASRR